MKYTDRRMHNAINKYLKQAKKYTIEEWQKIIKRPSFNVIFRRYKSWSSFLIDICGISSEKLFYGKCLRCNERIYKGSLQARGLRKYCDKCAVIELKNQMYNRIKEYYKKYPWKKYCWCSKCHTCGLKRKTIFKHAKKIMTYNCKGCKKIWIKIK